MPGDSREQGAVGEQLRRVLRTPEVLFIGINGVVGGGILLLPGQVAAQAGGAGAVWAYLAAGLVIVLIGLCYAEAGTMYDRTGGPLVYAREAMGKTAGFSVGWMVWLTYLAGWAVLLIIFAYGGFEAVTIPAGEMRNPRRAISVAVLGTLAAVTFFYMLIQYAALRIEPVLAGTETPLASAGGAMFAGGLAFMPVGALISIFGTQSGVALTSPRRLYALSREEMLPAFLSAVHRRFRTPVVSIWLTGALVAVLAVTGTFAQLILLNVAARLYQYLMVCASVAILRYRAPERPFRLPFGPALPVIAAVLCIALLTRQPAVNLLVALGALAAGLALYFVARSRKSSSSERNS